MTGSTITRDTAKGTSVLRRLLTLLIAFPSAVCLIALAIANRRPVELALDPFNAEPIVSVALPLYSLLLGALIVGVIAGGAATWLGQSRFRKGARMSSADARRWRSEADRLVRERDQRVAGGGSRELVATERSRDAA